jgi:hypothetical protein
VAVGSPEFAQPSYPLERRAVVGLMNDMFRESIAANKFVTFFCSVLDANTRTFPLLQCQPSLSSSRFGWSCQHPGSWGRGARVFPLVELSGLQTSHNKHEGRAA